MENILRTKFKKKNFQILSDDTESANLVPIHSVTVGEFVTFIKEFEKNSKIIKEVTIYKQKNYSDFKITKEEIAKDWDKHIKTISFNGGYGYLKFSYKV